MRATSSNFKNHLGLPAHLHQLNPAAAFDLVPSKLWSAAEPLRLCEPLAGFDCCDECGATELAVADLSGAREATPDGSTVDFRDTGPPVSFPGSAEVPVD